MHKKRPVKFCVAQAKLTQDSVCTVPTWPVPGVQLVLAEIRMRGTEMATALLVCRRWHAMGQHIAEV